MKDLYVIGFQWKMKDSIAKYDEDTLQYYSQPKENPKPASAQIKLSLILELI